MIEKPMPMPMPKMIPVNLKRQADGFFGLLSPDRLLMLLELLVLTLLALQIARLGWTVATPVTPFGAWQPVATATNRPAIDPSALGGFDPFFRQRSDAASEVSSLGLTLLGTRVDTVSGRGSAIIAVPDGKQSSFLVGEEIVPGVKLKSVQFDGVTLDSGGKSESLFLDQSAGPAPVTPETAGLSTPAPPAPATAARARLAADIMITPRLKGSEITGYVLAPKGSGAAFAAAGLAPGDILVDVAGTAVANLDDPASITRQLDAGGVRITVERGGKPVELTIGASQ